MREASIEIETFDIFGLAKGFLRDRKLRVGSEIEIGEGIVLRYEESLRREAVTTPDIIHLTLIIARDIALPIALGIASNWLYDRIKGGRAEKVRIEGKEVQLLNEKIREVLEKEIKQKSPRKLYSIRLSFPQFSQHELLLAARTLSRKPVIFNGKELPYPDNMSHFSEYWSGNVEAIVYIRDDEINQLYRNGKSVYAKAQINDKLLPRLFFNNLILSSKPLPSGCKMKQIEREEDMPEWH